MQFQFLLHLPLLLCFNGNNVDAKRSLSTSDSILNYLVEQSLQAKSDLSRITNEDIQIGKRTIKISTSSTNRPRILDDEIVLIFHADGSIRTYDTQGQSSVLMRAGNFQIDSEIFNLVFPGFSMDTAGSTTTTEKELSNFRRAPPSQQLHPNRHRNFRHQQNLQNPATLIISTQDPILCCSFWAFCLSSICER